MMTKKRVHSDTDEAKPLSNKKHKKVKRTDTSEEVAKIDSANMKLHKEKQSLHTHEKADDARTEHNASSTRRDMTKSDTAAEKLSKQVASKRKNRKGKHKSKKKKTEETAKESDGNVAKTEAISYLQQWKNSRDNWNFQKVRQVWLLQHMLNPDDIDDGNFSIMIEYLEGLKGKAKELTLEKAQTSLEAEDTSDETAERIRQIVQILS